MNEDTIAVVRLGITRIAPQPEMYEAFIKLVGKTSRKNIPRGCRTEYIPALCGDVKPLLSRYQELYDAAPFAEETFQAGEVLMAKMAEDRTCTGPCNMLENLDMKVNSRRVWKTLKNLSGDATKPARNFIPVTPDQVGTQLLLNGKTKGKKPKEHISRDRDQENKSLGEVGGRPGGTGNLLPEKSPKAESQQDPGLRLPPEKQRCTTGARDTLAGRTTGALNDANITGRDPGPHSFLEEKLEAALEELATYYQKNHLKPNPSKTQVCAFHLKNKDARRELEIHWRGERLEH
ncbi:hypothetical protein QE152_g7996 [Popillia japonica]|uniref:Uncharacterized protein n=1 Tax=Popillia japonica TaxID=7064 RepID=A0AAW1MDI4_POPJA